MNNKDQLITDKLFLSPLHSMESNTDFAIIVAKKTKKNIKPHIKQYNTPSLILNFLINEILF